MKKVLNIATTFSGIGAAEHALMRLNIPHKIIFACDNGDIELVKQKKYSFTELERIIFKYNNNNLSKLYGDLLEYIKKLETKEEFLILKKNLNISDVFAFLDNLYKINTKTDNEKLKNLSKDKIARKIKRIYNEIIKIIRQEEEKQFIEKTKKKLEQITDWYDKKLFIDNLYKETKKINYVKKSYLANYQIDERDFHQDIRFLDATHYKNKVDLYVGGSPCQSFSIVGRRGGFEDTRGTLFYEYVRILKEIEPRFFIYENVKGVINHDKGRTWETMKNVFAETGYKFKYYILNAKDFGIPQNRERLFVVGFKYEEDYKLFKDPQKQKLTLKMKDFLEDNIESKYYLPEKGIRFVTDEKNLKKKYTQINGDLALCQKANQQFNWHGDFIEIKGQSECVPLHIDEKYFVSEKVKKYILDDKFFMNRKPSEDLIDLDIARPLTATMHKMHRAGVDNYISYGSDKDISKRKIRKLTPRECLRLMGFCDSFKIVVSDTQAYKQAGNSIVVNVLMSIIKNLYEIFEKRDLYNE